MSDCQCTKCVKGRAFWKRRCEHCGGKPWLKGDYMLKNSVWYQAELGPNDLCCLSCVPARLGRPLTLSDFAPVPANYPIHLGHQMGIRDATELDVHKISCNIRLCDCGKVKHHE